MCFVERNNKKKKNRTSLIAAFSCPVVPQVDVTLQEEQIGEGAGGRRETGILAAYPAEEVHTIPLS